MLAAGSRIFPDTERVVAGKEKDMSDHDMWLSAPRVHAPFPVGALDKTRGTTDARLATSVDQVDPAVRGRTKSQMPLG